MHKLIIFILLLCLSIDHAVAQQLEWAAARPLVWADFKGEKPHKTKWAAATFSYLRYTMNYSTKDSGDASITCMFNAVRSWKKRNQPTEYLLKHEQGHFNIAELYARKIRKAFSEYKARPNPKYHTGPWLVTAYRQNRSRMRRCQHKYDRQTRHSRRKEQQQYWDRKIVFELDEFKGFEQK